MNRKKITLLLTGLAIASSMFMGCSSSNNNNSSNGSGNVAQDNGGLRRATDRTVTDYNGDGYQADGTYGQYPATNYQENGYSYPNVAYADDITGIDNGNGVMSGIGGETNNAQYIDDNYTGNNGTNNVGINGGNTPNTNPSVGVSYYSMIDSNDPVGNSNISGYSMDDAQTPMNGLNGFGDTTEDYGTNNNMVPGSSLSEANSGNGTNDSLPNIVAPGVGGAVEGLGEIPHTSTQQGVTDSSDYSDTNTGLNNGTSTNGYGNTDVALNNGGTTNSGLNNNGTGYDSTSNNGVTGNGYDNTSNNGVNGNGYDNTSNNGVNGNGYDNTNGNGVDGTGYNNSTNSDVNGYGDNSNSVGYNAGMNSRAAQTLAGKMNVLRSIGGVELTGASGSKKPQGTIQVSFTLSGDILSTQIASASNATLDSIIQSAYSETLADANGGFNGKPTTTERQKLQEALKEIFKPAGDVKILLQDSKGQTVSIPYTAGNIATSVNGGYLRHIIDLDGMNSRSGGYSAKASLSDIPVSLILRNNAVDNTGNDELLTDTTYTFIGLSGEGVQDGNIPIAGNKYLTGFTVPSCTTGKAPSTLVVKSQGSTNVVYTSDNFGSSAGTAENGTVYTTTLTNKIYVDTETYDIGEATNFVAGGTNIKLKNFIFTDLDDSIQSIEVEDKDGQRYPCSLVSVNPDDDSKGEYLQIDGLRPETQYVFKNIYVTSNLSGQDEVDVIQLRKKGSGKVEDNAKVYSTIAFTEPTVQLGATGPKQMVRLPGGLEVQAVKNDSTALRYILKVDNSNGNIGELRVNSLRQGEESKVQKIVDNKTNTNFYVVTLTNLSPSTDYNFVTLELDYTDFDNNAGVSRISLAQVNSKTGDKTVDNVTEDQPVTGKAAFAVDVITENKADYARSAIIPVFIDDMNNRFVRMDYTVTGDNKDNVKAVYDGVDTLQVTGLTPNKQTTLNLSFVYNDENGAEQSVKKYVQISTPQAGDVDIISDTSTVSGNEVKIQLAYNGIPKSNIRSVVVKDENGKEVGSAWDPQTNTITLKGLDANKDYSGLVATFTLENTNKVNYPLTSFSTKDEIVKPTGPVANFVQRVYTVALGREPEVTGWNFWIDKLQKKEISATEFIAENLMTQKEFVEKELNKQQFVTTMYTLIVNREPDEEGQKYWEGKYDEYRQGITSIEQLRIKIAREMMDQPEFKELVSSIGLKY